jgi:hypothetical protein
MHLVMWSKAVLQSFPVLEASSREVDLSHIDAPGRVSPCPTKVRHVCGGTIRRGFGRDGGESAGSGRPDRRPG